jgi:hypothetical protein
MRRLRSHFSYANIAATLALLIAVAGGATAIAGSNAPKNSVTSNSIKPFNVTARDLAGVRVVQVSGVVTAFARCSQHERLIGGGGGASSVGVSAPRGNGWYVEQASGADRPVSASALCLKAKPGK